MNYVAIYIRTERGYSMYRVYPADMPASKRKAGNCYSVGGLPEWIDGRRVCAHRRDA